MGVAVFNVCRRKVGLSSVKRPREKTAMEGVSNSLTQVTSGGAVIRNTVNVIIAADSSKPG